VPHGIGCFVLRNLGRAVGTRYFGTAFAGCYSRRCEGHRSKPTFNTMVELMPPSLVVLTTLQKPVQPVTTAGCVAINPMNPNGVAAGPTTNCTIPSFGDAWVGLYINRRGTYVGQLTDAGHRRQRRRPVIFDAIPKLDDLR